LIWKLGTVNEFLGGIWPVYKGPELAGPSHGIWDALAKGAKSRTAAQTFVCQILVLNFICQY
jgi:hypothetical protein